MRTDKVAVEGTFLTLQVSFHTGPRVSDITVDLYVQGQILKIESPKVSDAHKMAFIVELCDKIRVCGAYDIHLGQPIRPYELQRYLHRRNDPWQPNNNQYSPE